ncbi:DDE-type integrase/transposase/recombinase [Flavobacterium bizetiae]|uniref:DDE-type integrase/transposase/recombinase n=1 Tax=Flavobacterium bizetiae TaxID=2704140 RepID=UPI003757BDD1
MKKRKSRVRFNWRMDDTYIKVKVIWCYLYRAVDKLGNTVDFLLTRRRQRMSAQSFLIKAVNNSCWPAVINRDKSGSNIWHIIILGNLNINIGILKNTR